MEKILNALKKFSVTYIASYEGIATLLIVLVMILKLLINRKATAIDFKKMVVSIPSEITFLVIGFLLSALLADRASINQIMACIVIALILLIIQYALERWLDDKISGNLKILIWIYIIGMYIASGILYTIVIYGGLC